MSLKKSKEIIRILFKFRVSRYKMFKTDTILGLISGLAYLLVNLLFWYLISYSAFFIDGWTYSNILVFIAFSELFFGVEGAIFIMASKFWRIIHEGMLDTLLIRPIDPRTRFLLLNIDYIGIISSFIIFTIILTISGERLNIFLVILGIVIVIISNLVLALIRLTLSYSAFWIGKMDALAELSDCITRFNKYPLVIMPKGIKIIFKTILPFYFFSTFSSEVVAGKLTIKTGVLGIIGLLFSLLFWGIINKIMWDKGRGRYESING